MPVSVMVAVWTYPLDVSVTFNVAVRGIECGLLRAVKVKVEPLLATVTHETFEVTKYGPHPPRDIRKIWATSGKNPPVDVPALVSDTLLTAKVQPPGSFTVTGIVYPLLAAEGEVITIWPAYEIPASKPSILTLIPMFPPFAVVGADVTVNQGVGNAMAETVIGIFTVCLVGLVEVAATVIAGVVKGGEVVLVQMVLIGQVTTRPCCADGLVLMTASD